MSTGTFRVFNICIRSDLIAKISKSWFIEFQFPPLTFPYPIAVATLVCLSSKEAVNIGPTSNSLPLLIIFDLFKLTPQILENVKVKDKSIINSTKCKVAIKKSERIIKNYGRMLVRKSGTEPKIRIMGESNNIHLLKKCINIVKRSIK